MAERPARIARHPVSLRKSNATLAWSVGIIVAGFALVLGSFTTSLAFSTFGVLIMFAAPYLWRSMWQWN